MSERNWGGTCTDCKYWEPDDEDCADAGKCTRYPPQVVGNGDTFFPITSHTWSCGEWRDCGEQKWRERMKKLGFKEDELF